MGVNRDGLDSSFSAASTTRRITSDFGTPHRVASSCTLITVRGWTEYVTLT